MLGLLLIYFIGRAFYRLAHDYNKNNWLYAILGIVMYYVGTFFGGVVIAIFFGEDFFETQSSIVQSLVAIPFGLLFDLIFYLILESVWKRAKPVDINTLDSNLLNL